MTTTMMMMAATLGQVIADLIRIRAAKSNPSLFFLLLSPTMAALKRERGKTKTATPAVARQSKRGVGHLCMVRNAARPGLYRHSTFVFGTPTPPTKPRPIQTANKRSQRREVLREKMRRRLDRATGVMRRILWTTLTRFPPSLFSIRPLLRPGSTRSVPPCPNT